MVDKEVSFTPKEEKILTRLELKYHLEDGLLRNKVEELRKFSKKCEESDMLMDIFMRAKDATPDSDLGQMMAIATNDNPKFSGTILGKVIDEAAALEAERRKAISMLFAKFGYNKSAARDMLVGYYVDDDGTATSAPDECGHRECVLVNGEPEMYPGDFLKFPPKLFRLTIAAKKYRMDTVIAASVSTTI